MTGRIRSTLEWMVCCFSCSRISIILQMISIILRSGDLNDQSWQSTSLIYFCNFVCTVYRCIAILEIPLIIFEFFNDWPKIMVKDVYVLGRVNISCFICDCANSVFTNTPNIFQTHVRRQYDFHTILGIVCSTFTQIVATYTHVHLSLAPPAFHWTILFYSIVLVLPSVVYFGTIAHDWFFFVIFYYYYSTKLSVFSQQFFCESHFYSIVFELTFYKSELEQTD